MKFAPANRIPSLDGLLSLGDHACDRGHLWGGLGTQFFGLRVDVIFVLSVTLLPASCKRNRHVKGESISWPFTNGDASGSSRRHLPTS